MGKVDILIVAETKIDASFSKAQFSPERYHKLYRLDVSERSGGIFNTISHLEFMSYIKLRLR